MFTIEQLTHDGWVKQANHCNRENAFWHARLKMDSTGHTHRVISTDKNEMCILTSSDSTWCNSASNELFGE